MSTNPTPQGLPLDRPRYLQETPDGWQGADHPDDPWRPIPDPQTQPPFSVGDGPTEDHYDREGEIAALILDHSCVDPERNLDRVLRECDFRATARAILARWGHPATPPAPAAEALAARPLLERVAQMGDRIGQHTVAEITAISDRAASWLRENPPGQPVAIEPRGCPTPGACSCVESAPEPPPTVRYEFEITDEHGQAVASGDADTLEVAEREGRHYLGQYQQDGPCTLELRRVEVLSVSAPELQPIPAPAAAEPPLWQLMAHAYDNAPAPSRDAPDGWTDWVGYAAEILAVRDRVVPEEAPPVAPTDGPAWLHWQQRQAIRARLTAEAARAERGE